MIRADSRLAISRCLCLDICNGEPPLSSFDMKETLNLFRLGVKTRVFHLGDYRRATMGADLDVPDDYFFVNASASSVMLRQKILKKCREDIYAWLNHENGQIAIYDAVNPLSAGRRSLAKEFAKHDVQVFLTNQNQSYSADKMLDFVSRILRQRRQDPYRECAKCEDLLPRCNFPLFRSWTSANDCSSPAWIQMRPPSSI